MPMLKWGRPLSRHQSNDEPTNLITLFVKGHPYSEIGVPVFVGKHVPIAKMGRGQLQMVDEIKVAFVQLFFCLDLI